MEMSMYHPDHETDKTQQLKKNMFLDLPSASVDDSHSAKKLQQQKLQNIMMANKDSNMLKLASPDLDRLYNAQTGVMTTTPTPTQFIYPNYVTDEQEAYARGFVEALAELHETGPEAPTGAPQTITSTTAGRSSKEITNTSTYSTLMPMASATVSTAMNHSPYLATSTTSTLVNMNNGHHIGSHHTGVRRHPYVPSKLAAPHPKLHQPNAQNPIPSSTSYGTIAVQVKEEPSCSSFVDQTVPQSPSSSRFSDSPSMSHSPSSAAAYDQMMANSTDKLDGIPVDLEEQEKIKVERKRARNRIAARKCRTRKLERISRLEEKVAELKAKNNELAQTAQSLSDQVVQLERNIMDHIDSGCQIMMPDRLRQMGRMAHHGMGQPRL